MIYIILFRYDENNGLGRYKILLHCATKESICFECKIIAIVLGTPINNSGKLFALIEGISSNINHNNEEIFNLHRCS